MSKTQCYIVDTTYQPLLLCYVSDKNNFIYKVQRKQFKDTTLTNQH